MPRLTSFVLRHRLLVVAFWLVLAALGGATVATTTGRLSQSFATPDSPAQQAAQKIAQAYHTDDGVEPDVVVVQLGGSYARKVVLPHKKAIHRLRADGNRRAGRLIYLAHRLIRQWVRFVGWYRTPYPGTAPLERFLMQLREAWPAARIVLMPPFPRSHNYRKQLGIAERTDSDVKAAAKRCGVAVLDPAGVLGYDPSLRCANAYNLNGKGAALVGHQLADWLVAHAAVQQAAA